MEESEYLESFSCQETIQEMNESTHCIIIVWVGLRTRIDRETFAALTNSWASFKHKRDYDLAE